MRLVLGLKLILELHVLLLSSESIYLGILSSRAIHNCKEELQEYLSLLGLPTSELLCGYEIL
jgi:hypothetical protein